MFIRIYRPDEHKELLLNLDHISKIEVMYGRPGSDKALLGTSIQDAQNDPEAIRVYRVYIADEVIQLANDDPVKAAIEEIYKKALKG